MTEEDNPVETQPTIDLPPGSGLGLAIALAGLAAIGAVVVVQQLLEKRLSRPERARLRFYRYLRERGHLES